MSMSEMNGLFQKRFKGVGAQRNWKYTGLVTGWDNQAEDVSSSKLGMPS